MQGMEMEIRPKNPNWKVKVYLLNDIGNWDDCGTGTLEMCKNIKNDEESYAFKVIKVEDKGHLVPQVVSNERLEKLKNGDSNPNIILSLPVLKNYEFEKQGGGLFVVIQEKIQTKLKDIPMKNSKSYLYLSLEIWKLFVQKYRLFLLINCKAGIKKDEYGRANSQKCKITSNQIKVQEEFLDRLFQLFDDCEDLEQQEKLAVIHDIVKMMGNYYQIFDSSVFVDDLVFIQHLLSDKHYMQVFGALEYDSENPPGYRPKYREFLKNESTYKPVIEFKDPKILNKIHLNFRITFLRDTVVSSIIDDPLTNQFNTMIYYNNHEIYDHIMSHSEYFVELFKKFNEKLRDSIGFLYELVQIVKTLIQVENKLDFAKQMVERNLFSIIGKAFFHLHTSNQPEVQNEKNRNILKINLIEILTLVVQLQVSPFIDYMRSNHDALMLFNSLVQNLFYGDQGLQIQITELIKFLIDNIHEKKNELLDYFYDNFLPAFLEHYKKQEKDEAFVCFVQQYTDILSWCLKLHGYRIRHYIIHQKLLQVLYIGIQRKEKLIPLSIIKFVRNILINKDEFLLKYLINSNLLDEIFEIYLQNAAKNNLINSTCLDLFDTIRKENLKKLLNYFIDRFKDKIKEKNLEKQFHKLFLTFEKFNDTYPLRDESHSNSETTSNHKNNFGNIIPDDEQAKNYNERELSCMEDEDYFESDEAMNSEVPKDQSIHQQINTPKIENEISTKEKESVQKLHSKLKIKHVDEEDLGFVFGSKPKSQQSPVAKLKIQFNINSKLEESDINQKRQGPDLESDEEIKDEVRINIEKKQKIGQQL